MHAIIHNRSAIYGKKQATCFEAMSKEQADVLWRAYVAARDGGGGVPAGSHTDIFNLDRPGGPALPQDADEFAQASALMFRRAIHAGQSLLCPCHEGSRATA